MCPSLEVFVLPVSDKAPRFRRCQGLNPVFGLDGAGNESAVPPPVSGLAVVERSDIGTIFWLKLPSVSPLDDGSSLSPWAAPRVVELLVKSIIPIPLSFGSVKFPAIVSEFVPAFVAAAVVAVSGMVGDIPLILVAPGLDARGVLVLEFFSICFSKVLRAQIAAAAVVVERVVRRCGVVFDDGDVVG